MLRAALAALLALGLAPTLAQARHQAPEPGSAAGRPVQSLLAPDGTLALNGYQGAIDPAGYRMGVLPDGRPHFLPVDAQPQAAFGDSRDFDPRFSDGATGEVRVIAAYGADVVVGGLFTAIGGIAANRVARYSPATGTWSGLGFGVNGEVEALASSGANLYIGGTFTAACQNAVCDTETPGYNRLALWNGTSYSPLAFGLDDDVLGLAFHAGVLHIGGEFLRACADAACAPAAAAGLNRVATWNGSVFGPLSFGLNARVYALASTGATLFIGGLFNRICTNADCSGVAAPNGANRVVSWTGLAFAPLQNGLNGTVVALAASGSTLYVGGNFTLRCSNADCSTTVAANGLNRIAAWSGVAYSALQNGLRNSVRQISVSSSIVYAAGSFQGACTAADCSGAAAVPAANRVAYFSGGAWSGLGNGLNAPAHGILATPGRVYIGGQFHAPCASGACTAPHLGVRARGMVFWDGVAFASPGGAALGVVGEVLALAASGTVNAFATVGSSLYLGGRFAVAGDVSASSITRYGEYADIGITGPGAVSIPFGSASNIQFVFTNAGPTTASTIALVTVSNATLVSITSVVQVCAASPCVGPAIPAGGGAQLITITILPNALGAASVTVVAGGLGVDAFGANNTAVAAITVVNPTYGFPILVVGPNPTA